MSSRPTSPVELIAEKLKATENLEDDLIDSVDQNSLDAITMESVPSPDYQNSLDTITSMESSRTPEIITVRSATTYIPAPIVKKEMTLAAIKVDNLADEEESKIDSLKSTQEESSKTIQSPSGLTDLADFLRDKLPPEWLQKVNQVGSVLSVYKLSTSGLLVSRSIQISRSHCFVFFNGFQVNSVKISLPAVTSTAKCCAYGEQVLEAIHNLESTQMCSGCNETECFTKLKTLHWLPGAKQIATVSFEAGPKKKPVLRSTDCVVIFSSNSHKNSTICKSCHDLQKLLIEGPIRPRAKSTPPSIDYGQEKISDTSPNVRAKTPDVGPFLSVDYYRVSSKFNRRLDGFIKDKHINETLSGVVNQATEWSRLTVGGLIPRTFCWPCTDCTFSGVDERSLRRHQLRECPQRRVKCVTCQRAMSYALLVEHAKTCVSRRAPEKAMRPTAYASCNQPAPPPHMVQPALETARRPPAAGTQLAPPPHVVQPRPWNPKIGGSRKTILLRDPSNSNDLAFACVKRGCDIRSNDLMALRRHEAECTHAPKQRIDVNSSDIKDWKARNRVPSPVKKWSQPPQVDEKDTRARYHPYHLQRVPHLCKEVKEPAAVANTFDGSLTYTCTWCKYSSRMQDRVKSHELVCGSQYRPSNLRKCLKCHRSFGTGLYYKHVKSCRGEPATFRCEYCRRNLPRGLMYTHQCKDKTSILTSRKARWIGNGSDAIPDPEEISSSPLNLFTARAQGENEQEFLVGSRTKEEPLEEIGFNIFQDGQMLPKVDDSGID